MLLLKHDTIKKYNFEYKNINTQSHLLSRTGRPLTKEVLFEGMKILRSHKDICKDCRTMKSY